MALDMTDHSYRAGALAARLGFVGVAIGEALEHLRANRNKEAQRALQFALAAIQRSNVEISEADRALLRRVSKAEAA